MNVSAAPRTPLSFRSLLSHPLAWLLAMALAHVVVRVAVSPALKWDEAEQTLWSQQLALGYGAQPPLYTWLQWLANQVFGPSVLALSVLKHSLLALTFWLMYLAGRELLGERGAFWASASMLLIPPLGWYSVRDHTHTILVTAMACGAWLLLMRIARRPRALDFALLGLACGLGMLSKYSFALVAGAMLVAALSVPHTRAALLSRGWWWAPIAGLVVVLPHMFWLASHLAEATSGTLSKMDIQASQGWVRGVGRLLEGVVGSTLLLWALVALWAFRSAWWRRPMVPASAAMHTVFMRYLALIAAVLLGMVLFAGVTNFKGRWLVPLLCMVPLVVFAARPELQQHPRARRYSGAVVGMALLILFAAAVRPWFSGLRGEVDELNHPASELATALRAVGYDGVSPIIAADHMLAGTLRTRFPHAPAGFCDAGKEVATCAATHMARARDAGQGLLLISRDDALDPDWWPSVRAGLGASMSAGAPALALQSIRLPFHMVRKGAPPAHYQLLWQPAEAGGVSAPQGAR